MLLWLDGDVSRAATFYQRLAPRQRRDIIWCKTPAEAIRILEEPEYLNVLYEAHLEYKLNNEFLNQDMDDPNCGMEVVRHVVKNPDKYNKIRFVIHTWDISMGNVMIKALKEAGLDAVHIPFGS